MPLHGRFDISKAAQKRIPDRTGSATLNAPIVYAPAGLAKLSCPGPAAFDGGRSDATARGLGVVHSHALMRHPLGVDSVDQL